MATKTHLSRLKDDLRRIATKRYGAPGWEARHANAFKDAGALILLAGEEATEERAIVFMLAGWLAYADAHRRRYGSGIGGDGVLGPDWAEGGEKLRGLLDGDLGRLEATTLDRLILETLAREGFER